MDCFVRNELFLKYIPLIEIVAAFLTQHGIKYCFCQPTHVDAYYLIIHVFMLYGQCYLYTMQIIDLRGNRPEDKQHKVKIDVHYNFFAFWGGYFD